MRLNSDVVSLGRCCPADEGVCLKRRLSDGRVDVVSASLLLGVWKRRTCGNEHGKRGGAKEAES